MSVPLAAVVVVVEPLENQVLEVTEGTPVVALEELPESGIRPEGMVAREETTVFFRTARSASLQVEEGEETETTSVAATVLPVVLC
jgi:hypothetical protein